jgi:hypothetical protein
MIIAQVACRLSIGRAAVAARAAAGEDVADGL